ncbi:MAG: hypothetical protein U0694_02020 [Anaerolineae bacterium]
MPAENARTFENAPLEELFSVLLRQFKRPLKDQGFNLSDKDGDALAQGIVSHQPDSRAQAVLEALTRVVTESENVLSHWGLTFEKSLDVNMDNLPGWQSTAEFLELATEKSNAELRIAAGAALVLVLGDKRYKSYLQYLAKGNYGDETIIAKRALAFANEPL